MSILEQSGQERRDLDFWDYVSCSKCHLLFTPDQGGPPPVPFWITECGHIICNSHLSRIQPLHTMCNVTQRSPRNYPGSDGSCAKCGAKEIQVAPLQREACILCVQFEHYNHPLCLCLDGTTDVQLVYFTSLRFRLLGICC